MTPCNKLYQKLLARYGQLDWWPAQTPYEMMVGAVLTQNTAWSNVERALANFGDGLTPGYIAALPIEELGELIRPSGFFKQKAAYLKGLTAWYARYDYSAARALQHTLPTLRQELLALTGIGPETADSILLYAFNLPVFVVDAYTKRLCARLPIAVEPRYEAIQALFEAQLPHNAAIYNNCHALIVTLAKEYCRKKPRCSGCPLEDDCKKTGVSL